MRAFRFVDVPISEDRDLPFELNQKILGITLINQSTAQAVTFAMGSQNPFVNLEAGASTSRGNINMGNDAGYLTGNLVIKSTDWSSTSLILVYCHEVVGDQSDC